MVHRTAAIFSAVLILAGLPLLAQSPRPQDTTLSRPAVLVELFTSEGCSDCPPADALLRQVNGMKTAQGKLIVGISEHVTYWNRLGWADPFSADVYTDRQNAYGNRFRLDDIYTPQMVVNGSAQFVGSDRSALEPALSDQGGAPVLPLHIVSAAVMGDHLNVTYTSGAAPSGTVLYAVLADELDHSKVLRGENEGRVLTHVAVARSLPRIGALDPNAPRSVELPLPDSFRAGAPPGHHVILFAQSPSLGPVLGIDAKAL